MEQTPTRAETEVVFIYVSSRPVFHQYSRQLREMSDLAVQVEQKDGYTADHCRRIMSLSMELGRRLGLSPARLYVLHFAAFHHDLGKVVIPDSVLGKPGPLTEAEWAIVRRHPTAGREMVEGTSMREAGPIIEQHHERLDGSGYPRELRGDEISIEAQIVAVVDAFDAMTTDRVYKKAKTVEQAIRELQEEAGKLYREDVVGALLDHLETTQRRPPGGEWSGSAYDAPLVSRGFRLVHAPCDACRAGTGGAPPGTGRPPWPSTRPRGCTPTRSNGPSLTR